MSSGPAEVTIGRDRTVYEATARAEFDDGRPIRYFVPRRQHGGPGSEEEVRSSSDHQRVILPSPPVTGYPLDPRQRYERLEGDVDGEISRAEVDGEGEREGQDRKGGEANGKKESDDPEIGVENHQDHSHGKYCGHNRGGKTVNSNSNNLLNEKRDQDRCSYPRCMRSDIAKLLVCGGCKNSDRASSSNPALQPARYCSPECQRRHWAAHRLVCPYAARQRISKSVTATVDARGKGKIEKDKPEVESLRNGVAKLELTPNDEKVQPIGNGEHSHLVYFLEVMKNIKCIRVLIFPSDNNVSEPLANILEGMQIQTFSTRLLCHYSRSADKNDLCKLEIDLAGSVIEPEKAVVQKLSDHVSVRLPLKPNQTAQSAPEAWDNDYYFQGHPHRKLPTCEALQNLYCRKCNAQLLRGTEESTTEHLSSPITKVFSLPSEYWLELADCWSCGSCCAFRQFPKEEIRAQPGVIFVGGAFLLVIGSHLRVRPDPTVRQEMQGIVSGGSDLRWEPVFCECCKEPIGIGEIANQENLQGTGCVRLFNYKIANSLSPTNLFRNDSLDNFVASCLVTTSGVHSCYRFRVCSLESRRTRANIVLMSWDSFGSTNLDSAQAGTTKPLLRLRYEASEESCAAEPNEDSDAKEELMLLWEGECTELLRLLELRNRSLPLSLRWLGKLRLSYLCLPTN